VVHPLGAPARALHRSFHERERQHGRIPGMGGVADSFPKWGFALTAPSMHDGGLATLEGGVDF
jgi:hypothetical protein